MDPDPLHQGSGGSKWQLSNRARAVVTRIVLSVLVVVSLDGALTWYATDRAADTVASIVDRDGEVIIDETETGMAHEAEIRRVVGDDGDRVRLGALKWIPAVLLALAAGVFSTRADPLLHRTLIMTVALALAIWVAPRVAYSRELPTLDAVFG